MRFAVATAVALTAASFVAVSAQAAGPVPDISGTYWATNYSPKLQVMGGGEPPLNEKGRAAYQKNQAGLKDGSLVDKARRVCTPDGMPRVLATPYPFEIFQTPADQVTVLYEMNHQTRTIVMDKPLSTLESLITEPLYNGHSVAHWEGDTLVVQSIGFNDRTFLDATGLPHSDEMITTERIRKTGDQLEDIVTIHDPELYARDWQARFAYKLRNDLRLEDYACNDSHRDLSGVAGVRR
jgi:hypothetical protein